MRAALRALMSFDVEDLSSWSPESEEWSLGLRILAGPSDGPGEESFDLTVCSAEWLAALARRDGVVDARHHLVVDGFNWPAVRTYIERRVKQCEGESWRKVAKCLSRLGCWEFEDDQPA